MFREIFPFALLAFLGLLLYAHFRWVDIDPHNPVARPGRVWTAVKAALVMLLIAVSFSLVQSNETFWASVLGSFALGMVAGPAITPPMDLREDQEPHRIVRVSEKWMNSLSGGFFKTIIVMLVAWPAGFVLPSHPAYWVTATLACISSIPKVGIALILSKGDPALELNYFNAGLYERVLPTAITGILALVVWYPLVFPMVEAVPPMSLDNHASIIALWFGLVVGEALSG